MKRVTIIATLCSIAVTFVIVGCSTTTTSQQSRRLILKDAGRRRRQCQSRSARMPWPRIEWNLGPLRVES
jgi:hypothetical protein